jgi:hypothetical protein
MRDPLSGPTAARDPWHLRLLLPIAAVLCWSDFLSSGLPAKACAYEDHGKEPVST